jgi:hypothetical protein
MNVKIDKYAIAGIIATIGVPGLISLAQWAQSQPSAHLWSKNWFQGVFIILAAGVAGAIVAFVSHWRWRVIAPALIALAYGCVSFSVPAPYALVSIIAALLLTAYWVAPRSGDQATVTSPTEMQGERDLARDEAKSLRAQLAEAVDKADKLETEISKEFPELKALVLEWQTPDPPEVGPDLHAAFIVSMTNFGAPSAVVSYKVSALSPSGMQVDTEVFQTARLAFTLEGGTVQADYNQSDYIMNRTMAPVTRGAPLIGVLPVVFHNTRDLKEVDMRTFKVRFSDGTGTRDRKAKWWETEPIVSAQDSKAVPHKRPTLSPLMPVSQSPPKWPV